MILFMAGRQAALQQAVRLLKGAVDSPEERTLEDHTCLPGVGALGWGVPISESSGLFKHEDSR